MIAALQGIEGVIIPFHAQQCALMCTTSTPFAFRIGMKLCGY